MSAAVLQVGTKDYATDVVLLKKAMSQMESLLSAYNGYALSEPTSKFGWTFFNMAFRTDMQQKIEGRFGDMINQHRWGNSDEKFTKFMQKYLHARGCNVELKLDKRQA
ncbi:MAG: hypothetical protein F4Y82_04470 [Cenarchaeum sp. SB0665_bin_23]|nr:hypothetical protein [Cenarchaeum sp. SB0667_bin_13]MXY61349.1 hypothetical protein [Cenarchaeum sp. SB0665_bin_23]MXZ93624.1 hypothetical protein [Cenarchaeum sp. SB0666_bin_15]MYC79737.1 hypothetical protein [Cenarchaeum sp. SB0661_bin_35]MYD58202.1 hypothetical protein [Cenarchaeum sp. SB0678_bin_8]MYG33296.1 hypothetical protein [Cenarchaeum sp. SB0677_bin_16]MYI52010.1 hypothetical protein [Cenarchaeum sp. SB0673_bin_9]MYJ27462.1 hypothetical protein [Cenarchaeum sp. SB0672_bin_9]